MDRGSLAELVPGAQDYILEFRQYQADVEALQAPVEALRSRMEAVMDFYKDLYLGLQQVGRNPYEDPIILDKVEATEAIEDEPARPAGVVEVTVTAFTHDRSSPRLEWQRHGTPKHSKAGFDTNNPTEAFELMFAFRATDDLKKEVRSESSLATSGSNETDDDKPTKQIMGGIENPPSKFGFDFDGDGPERLEAYKETYLAQRTADIEKLEASMQLIQEALNDPVLNPWAEGFDLAALKHERAEGAYQVAMKAWTRGEGHASIPPERADFGLDP